MIEFFFRHGEALSYEENIRVRVGARRESGFLTRAENCPRCGGAGGSTHWHPDGGICYQCQGKRTIQRTHRVFIGTKLFALNVAATKKAAKKAEAAQRKMDARRIAFDEWAEPHKILLGEIAAATGNSFLTDLAAKLVDHRQLTDRQLEAAATSIERQEQRDADGKASEYVGEIKERIEFEAEVTGVYGTEGHYGHTDIVKFKDGDRNMFTWFASGYTDLERGDRITIKGTVKKHDDFKGVKQTVLTRCKFTKFEVVDPDAVADLEEVA